MTRLLSAAIIFAAAVLVPAAPAHAVIGLIVHIGWSAQTGNEAFKTATAVCPAGKVILGGGADIVDGGDDVKLTSMIPGALGKPTHSYYATAGAQPDHVGDWTVYSWAICGSGVTGWQKVTATAANVGPGNLTSVSAVCPAGKKVIGTGVASTGGSPYFVDGVVPSSGLTSVLARAAAGESATPGAAWGVHAYAICVNPVPGLQLVTTTTAATSANKFASAECPAGKKLHGAGAGLTGAPGQTHLDRVGLHGLGAVGGADIEAHEDDTGYLGTWSAAVYAICAI